MTDTVAGTDRGRSSDLDRWQSPCGRCPECTMPHIRLIIAHWKIRDLRYVARHGGQVLQIVSTDRIVAELQFQIGDDRNQIRVAAAFAVAIHAALYMRAPGLVRR